jgi:hypothetical protein
VSLRGFRHLGLMFLAPTIHDAAPFIGVRYWIPAFWVPALLVTHWITFVVLVNYWPTDFANRGVAADQ